MSENWYFKVVEVSPGVYRVTGTDGNERRVEATGTEPDAVLQECREAASRIAEAVARGAACCGLRPAKYAGCRVVDVPGLGGVVELSTDTMAWTTTYECPECNCLWYERFVERGHGEVPEVVRAPEPHGALDGSGSVGSGR